MKILVIGLGSIGLRHVEIIKKIRPLANFYALRSKKQVENFIGINNLYDPKEISNYEFDFAIISSPSYFHHRDIKLLMELNIPLIVEKPLVTNLKQLQSISKFEIKHNIYVAYNMRFHPLIVFVKEYINNKIKRINEVNSYYGSYLPEWRPKKNYKNIYSAIESLGGGVHLDLVHEPDYIIHLFGFPLKVNTKYRKVSQLEIDTVDYANIEFEYEKFTAQITLNYFRKDKKRTLEIITDDDSIVIDFVKNKIYSHLNKQYIFSSDKDLMAISYTKQIEYFFSIYKNKTLSESNFNSALMTMKVLL